MCSHRSALIAALGLATAGPATTAVADPPRWRASAEVSGVLALSEPQRSWFGVGGSVSAALTRRLGEHWELGGRVRGGALSNGDTPGGGLMDPGSGGLLGFTAVVRAWPMTRRGGPWIEVGGGGAITGELLRGSFEGGVGWRFAASRWGIGPTIRYLQVVQPSTSRSQADAQLLLAGLEIDLGGPERRSPRPAAPPPEPPASDQDGDKILDGDDACPDLAEDRDDFQDDDGCPDLDNDGDGVLDVDDRCPREAEVINDVDDGDGCADQGLFEVVADRIVLEERVLFDSGRARVRRAGVQVLRAIITFWGKHPEYDRIIIEGHADRRGPEAGNLRLSRERAERVKRALTHIGVPVAKMEVVAYGESRPRASGDSAEANTANRRVEFVLVPAVAKAKPSSAPDAAPTPTATPEER